MHMYAELLRRQVVCCFFYKRVYFAYIFTSATLILFFLRNRYSGAHAQESPCTTPFNHYCSSYYWYSSDINITKSCQTLHDALSILQQNHSRFSANILSKYTLFMLITIMRVCLDCVIVDRRYVLTLLKHEKARPSDAEGWLCTNFTRLTASERSARTTRHFQSPECLPVLKPS